jgi:hypothetical protein
MPDFKEISSTIFLKKTPMRNFMNVVQWKQSCSTRKVGQTHMIKVAVAFRNFAKAPKQQQTVFAS